MPLIEICALMRLFITGRPFFLEVLYSVSATRARAVLPSCGIGPPHQTRFKNARERRDIGLVKHDVTVLVLEGDLQLAFPVSLPRHWKSHLRLPEEGRTFETAGSPSFGPKRKTPLKPTKSKLAHIRNPGFTGSETMISSH